MMDLPKALAEAAAEVEATLDGVLSKDGAPDQRIYDAMRYTTLGGGKRLRPFLVLQSAGLFDVPKISALRTGAALELIHCYSLVHDDLPAMDDDDLRRGMPTSHVKFGENVAILAGDGLFAEAIGLFCSRQQGDPRCVLDALGELVAATGVGGMVGGQYVDVTEFEAAARAGGGVPPDLDPERLREMHALKTGRLIGASVGVVLVLGEVPEAETIPYRRFAEELGVLFQIVDDILDVTGSDEELGKPSGSDERHGKLTYVSAYGLERARELAAESHRKARAALAEASPGSDDLTRITDFIHTRHT
jgi:geranylgeranyl diphosphate synthase type II